MTVKCEIVSWIQSSDPFGRGVWLDSPTVALSQCNTHHFSLGQGQFHVSVGAGISDGTLCPIGRVEKAVEDGVARIEAKLAEMPR